MNKLKLFSKAIEQYEVYKPGSLTWRNNNPGALRWSIFQVGQRSGFSYFNSYEDGFKALMWDVEQKCKGNTRTKLGPESTIYEFFTVWSPTHDNNDPLKYAQFVARAVGLTIKSKLKEVNEQIEPIQRILVLLNNFKTEKKKDIVREAFEDLRHWFNDLDVETSIEFHTLDTPMIPIITVNGLAGLDYVIQPVNILDSKIVNKYIEPFIVDHHFVVFCYYQENPGVTPTEFHNFLLGSLVTQLPVLEVSNQSWIEVFSKHELLHGWYIRAIHGGASVKDDVHTTEFGNIVVKLKPYLSLIFNRDLVPYIFKKEEDIRGFQISWSRKLINLMKELISKLI